MVAVKRGVVAYFHVEYVRLIPWAETQLQDLGFGENFEMITKLTVCFHLEPNSASNSRRSPRQTSVSSEVRENVFLSLKP